MGPALGIAGGFGAFVSGAAVNEQANGNP